MALDISPRDEKNNERGRNVLRPLFGYFIPNRSLDRYSAFMWGASRKVEAGAILCGEGWSFSKFIATFARFYCLASEKLTASVVKATQKIGFDLPSCDF